jgi:uncharacterized membrane protein
MDSNSRPAAQGWTWIVDAWTLFTRAPVPWLLLTIVFIVLSIAMNAIVIVGQLAAVVLAPVFVGGVMLGCRRLHEGGMLEVGDLFAGFRTRLGTLAALGAFSLVVLVAIVFIAGLITGFSLFTLGANPDPAAIAAALVSILLTLLIVTALMLPLAMALWFAPPLVVFQGKGAFEAMAQSFVACLRNMLPFLIYGLILLVFSILASIPFGLGWLVLGPVFAASVYTAYRDIFPS